MAPRNAGVSTRNAGISTRISGLQLEYLAFKGVMTAKFTGRGEVKAAVAEAQPALLKKVIDVHSASCLMSLVPKIDKLGEVGSYVEIEVQGLLGLLVLLRSGLHTGRFSRKGCRRVRAREETTRSEARNERVLGRTGRCGQAIRELTIAGGRMGGIPDEVRAMVRTV